MITTIPSLICPSALTPSQTAPVIRSYSTYSRPTWRGPRVAPTVNRRFTTGTFANAPVAVTDHSHSAPTLALPRGIAGSASAWAVLRQPGSGACFTTGQGTPAILSHRH